MKTKFLLPLWLAICTLFVYGCAPELAEEFSPPAQETIDPEIIALIEEMGFKTDDIYATDDSYWVEGDIVISKKYLEELKGKPKTRQNYYGENNLVAYDRIGDVKIAMSNNGSSETAMTKCAGQLDGAIAAFNNLPNCAVKVREVNYNQSPDITIQIGGDFNWSSPVHQEIICTGEIPNGNGYPGQFISVNAVPYPTGSDAGWEWSTIPTAKVKTALIHAIGHCLGLAHTKNGTSAPYPTGGFSELDQSHPYVGETFWGNDTASIMNETEHKYNNTIKEFSGGDKYALSFLYPSFYGGTIEINGGQTTASIMVGTVPPLFRNVREAAGGSGQITYKWQKSTSGPTSLADIPNTNSATYQEIYQLYEDTWYRRQALSGGETANSNVIKITVTPDPGQIAGNQAIASGAVPAPLTSVRDAVGIGSSGITYQWQKRESSSSWTNVSSNGTSKTYQPGALTTNTSYQRVAKSGSLTANSNIVSVTVIEFNPEISGPDEPTFNTDVTYETPTSLPPGVIFDGWDISPDTYLADELDNPVLEVKFIVPTEYTITANFILPGGATQSVEKVVEVPEFTSISGPSQVFANIDATYSIPSVLPTGVTFSGWSVEIPDPHQLLNNYTITGGTSDLDLNISFTAEGDYVSYTLAANFVLPNNTPYAIQKYVSAFDSKIYGPDKVRPMTHGIYYEAPMPPYGITFDGWTITPDTHYNLNTTYPITNIDFYDEGEYTLAANYSYDNGPSFSVTKSVSASFDTAFLAFNLYMNYSNTPTSWVGDADYFLNLGNGISTHVLSLSPLLNASQSSIKLFALHPMMPEQLEFGCEWKLNGVIQEGWTGTELNLDLKNNFLPRAMAGEEIRVSCRFRCYNYQDPSAGWGNTFVIKLDSRNIFYFE